MAKKKQRRNKITPEEARELMRKEFEGNWYGMKPMFGAIPTETGVILFPLDPIFSAKPWIIVFIDPAEVARRQTLMYCSEMLRRYEALGVTALAVLRCDYVAFRQAESVQTLIQRNAVKFPLVIDADGNLCRAFGVTEMPRILFYSGGKRLGDYRGSNLTDLELMLQPFLREKDPGLPLLPPFVPSEKVPITIARSEFGTQSRGAWPPEGLEIQGEWQREPERMVTSDPKAKISFKMKGSGLSMIAQSMARLSAIAKVLVQVQGGPAHSDEAGRDLIFDHEGIARLHVVAPALYHALLAVPPGTDVQLLFPEAHNAPIAIYGLRFIE